jgi:probable rRNA maturation factor
MALSLTIATELTAASASKIQEALDTIVEVAKTDAVGVISLALVDELTSRQLNQKFAGNDYATDVLSFNYFEGESDIPSKDDVLGEIVICLAVAERQASEHDNSLEAELIMLFVHGVLHLLGYDHKGSSRASFSALQDDIMKKLKLDTRNIFDGNIH